MKKIIGLLAVIFICILPVCSYAAVGDSGTYMDLNYNVISDKAVSITKYTGSAKEVTIPEKIGSYTVTKIGNTAFQDKATIEKITLPETISVIEDYNVFWYCKSLKSINLPKSLTYLATGAFSGCSSLEEIVIPDGITKLSKTFRGCTSLKKVVIPDSVTSIDTATFYTSALSGTTMMKSMTIYCHEGSYAQKFAIANGINYVIEAPEIEPNEGIPFEVTHREVTISDNKPQIKLTLKNNSYVGECTAYAAVYEKTQSDDNSIKLYDIATLPLNIDANKSEEELVFSFKNDYKDNLIYKIIILDKNMTPLLNTAVRELKDKNSELENYPKMNLFESNSSSSSWDKPIINNSAVTGWANLSMRDNQNYLPYEAYRSFPEITDRKVTLDFDFSLTSKMEDTRFAILDNETVVVGFIIKGDKLCLQQPNGSLTELGKYSAFNSSDEDAKNYVRAEFDLAKGRINYVRFDGEIVAGNLPLTTASNRIDGFDILTGVKAEGTVVNRQVRINCDYIVNEDFTNQFGVLPKDWEYELNGSSTSVYEINSRVPDRFSVDVDTSNGDFKAVKHFEKTTSNPVFEIMTLQPQKRGGLKFAVKNGEKSVIEISADGEEFVLKTGEYNEKFYKYQANVWYGLKAELDLINSKVNVFVNNKKVLSDISIDITDYSVDNIEIFATKDSRHFIYDDVKLYQKRIIPDDYVPQPVKPQKKANSYVMGMQVCNLWTEGQYNKSWDYVKSALNRMPLFGPYDEGNPEMNDWEIKWLIEHGIDYELIWAYPNVKYTASKGYGPIKPNVVREGHYIYDGFKNAEYSDMMKFAISFENDSINSGNEFYNEFFEVYVPYWIEYYLKDSRYLKIDGRPIFGVYVMDKFLSIFGTMGEEDELINQGIAKFRQMCIDAGVGNPYIISHGFGYTESTFKKYSVYDIDCIGLASWPKHEGLTWQKSDIKNMAKMGDKYDMDFVATLQPNLDLAAWEQRTGFFSSGEEFKNILKWTRDELPSLITHKNLSKTLLNFLTWNEFGEGHIMMPTQEEGFTYLDGIRDVYVSEDEHEDFIPEGEQVKRINRMVDSERLVTTIRENPIPSLPEDLTKLSVKKGWYFTSADDYSDWTAETAATISRQNGKMVVKPSSNEPIISLVNVPQMDLYDVTYVRIRMKGNTTSCGGNVKWTTDINTGFDDIKRTYFESVVGTATKVYDYYAPIGQSVKRNGKLTGFKLTPGLILDTTQKFEIESIELLSDNDITNGSKIKIGEKTTPTVNEPVYKNSVLMVPLRDVASLIGLKVGWYAYNDSYIIYDKITNNVVIEIGKTTAVRRNYSFELPTAPYCVSEKINDAVFVPATLFKECFNVEIEWDALNKTLEVYTAQ